MARLLLLIVLLYSSGSIADDSSIHAFTPPPGDTSVDFLSQIFGPVIDGMRNAAGAGDTQSLGANGNGQTVVGAIMSTFNLAVLMLSMLFVGWTTVKGTVDSAHDGELLGKKMSSVWVPLRTVAGTGLVLPLGSGFSLLQLGVLWLALQGAGVASTAWNVAMDHLQTSGTLGYVSIPDARPLAVGILRSQVCAAAMNKHYQESGRDTRIVFKAESIPVAFGSSPDVNSQQYMTEGYIDRSYSWVATDRKLNTEVCGTVKFQDSPSGKDMSSSLRGPLLAAHSQAVRTMIDELQPVAEQIVGWHTPQVGALDMAVSHYRVAMQEAARKAIDSTPDAAKTAFIQAAKDSGWVAAGSWWTSMTRLNDAVQTAINALPRTEGATIEQLEVQETLAVYRDSESVTDEYVKDRSGIPRAEALASTDWRTIRSADDFWRVLSAPAMVGLDNLTRRIAGANTSPVTQLRSVGNDIISIGLVLKASMFTAAGILGARDVSWTVGNVFDLSEALKTISGTAEWLSSSLWVIGAVLAYYLPAIPVIWWVMGVVRWLASVAEAVLAAPLMAAFLIHPDGDDAVGKSGPGWMLILAMVLQPVLLVIGLLVAILMTFPAGALVNSLFLQMVSGASGNTGVGLVGLVAWTSIYVTMMVLAMHSCLALVSSVPDGVMRYLAAQAGAQGIVKTADEATQRFEGGAGGAGAGLAKGGLPSGDGGMAGGGRSPGHSEQNSITNRDLLG
jgi:conjugal transfer/type IV secretion protein DotA/TraY